MEDFESELQKEEYIPRPRWQVWGARIGLAIFLICLSRRNISRILQMTISILMSH